MKKIFYTVIFVFCGLSLAKAQSGSGVILQSDADVKSSGMGNCRMGDADGMYIYSNPTSMLYRCEKYSGSFSYSRYPDINGKHMDFYATSAGYRLGKNVFSVGFRVMSGIEYQEITSEGDYGKTIKPKDKTMDIGYSRLLNEKLSLYAIGGIIDSKIKKTSNTGYFSTGAYYKSSFRLKENNFKYDVGLAISNLGGKLKYQNENNDLPTSVDFGGNIGMDFNENNRLQLRFIAQYYFTPKDADGLTGGVGAEYNFLKAGYLRCGYHFGNSENYATLGLGINWKYLNADFSYVLSNSDTIDKMWRIGIGFKF